MLRKLAIAVLLVLYTLTGSLAAFADDGDCVHRPAAHASLLQVADDGVDGHPAEQAHTCSGLCHLLSVAQLQDDGPSLAAPASAARQVPVTHAVGCTGHIIGVPTPPPNVVSLPH